MRLLTEPDFARKSKEQFIVSEETKSDCEEKYKRLRSYLDSLRLYSVSHHLKSKVEDSCHGVGYTGAQFKARVMSHKKFNAICREIILIDRECTRLLNIINA